MCDNASTLLIAWRIVMYKFNVGDVVKFKASITSRQLMEWSLDTLEIDYHPDRVFRVAGISPKEDGNSEVDCIVTKDSGFFVPLDFIDKVCESEEPTIVDALSEAQERINHLEQVLREIGDKAHYASTGPAVHDVYWEIRQMAYENI